MEEPILDFFKTFTDIQRLKMAALLVDEALTGKEIAARLGLRESDVPRQLAMLERLGLLARSEDRYRLDTKAMERLSRSVLAGLRTAPEARSDDENADDFERQVVKNFLLPDGRIREIPSQAKKRVALLKHVVQAFEPGVRYSEKQVNEILARYHSDFAMLRRYLYDDELLQREANGAAYWRRG